MRPVDSSALEAVAYDASLTCLDLAFRSGALYRYFGVPLQTYHDLLLVESKGKYFNAHIRTRFGFVQLRTAAPRSAD